jgi:AcrR family transcriptional regulator
VAYVPAAVREGQIVQAAHRVLVRDGLAKTSLRTVADEAGIALGTLQHVFSTKEALFRAVLENLLFSEEAASFTFGAPDVHQRFGDWLNDELVTWWKTDVIPDPNVQIAQFEVTLYALREGMARNLAQWQYEQYHVWGEAWVGKTAAARGWDLRIPLDQVARLTLAMIDGLLLQYLADPDPDRVFGDIRRIADAIAVVATGELPQA